MERALAVVHGHKLDRLEKLIPRSLPDKGSSLKIVRALQGGMSNINILASLNGEDVIIKLPALLPPFRDDYYSNLFSASDYLYHHEIGPRPLAHGSIDDFEQTPFIIIEYLKGQQLASLAEFSLSNIVETVKLRQRMNGLCPPNIPAYSASDYLSSIFTPLTSYHDLTVMPDTKIRELLDAFIRHEQEILYGVQDWNDSFMHGDFHEGNLIFTNEGARLLDFEYCAMGDSRVDLAYFRVQFEKSHPARIVASLVENSTYESCRQFEPLALAFAIGWTLERLLLLGADRIEPYAAKSYDWNRMVNYSRKKLIELERILST